MPGRPKKKEPDGVFSIQGAGGEIYYPEKKGDIFNTKKGGHGAPSERIKKKKKPSPGGAEKKTDLGGVRPATLEKKKVISNFGAAW